MRRSYRIVRPFLHFLGVDIVRKQGFPFATHIRRGGFTLTFDVGANLGQFAVGLRSIGYTGRVVSFEPIRAVYASLEANASKDPHWSTVHSALGRCAGSQEFYVGKETTTSSFRRISGDIVSQVPEWAVNRSEIVSVMTLDDIFSTYASPGELVFLKLDVQGFEDEVLAGAEKSLAKIKAIQIEMAVGEVYAGERQMAEQISFLRQHRFHLVDLIPIVRANDRLLQVDGYFEHD